MDYINNGSITVDSKTIYLAPSESYKIEVRFNDINECKLKYEAPISNSGTISADGIYTAPDRSGSYEVRISCANYPQIETYAYFSVE